MDYPENIVEKYLKASNKLKRFERIVFKRFAPNVTEVQTEFARLAVKFEESGIFQYAGMCHLGVAKCEMSTGNTVNECQAYFRAARAFIKANSKEGALRCYTQALDRTPDDSVLKAAIIREMTPLQPHYEGPTSTFASPSHRIYDLEMAAKMCIQKKDFLTALQHFDDIIDNITERKKQDLYKELLLRIEILRLLLLVALNLPPSRQSPSHIKLIEFFYHIGNFEITEGDDVTSSSASIGFGSPDFRMIPKQMKFVLGDIVINWCERNTESLIFALKQFANEFKSLNDEQRCVIEVICENLEKHS